MYCNTLFSVIIISFSIAFASSDNEGLVSHLIEFLDDDGVNHVIDTDAKPLAEHILKKLSKSKFLLYTRHNPDDAQYLIEGDFNSINNSDFNPDSITVVVVHGWLQSSSSLLNSNIRDPLLEESHVNVIVVDWSSVSRLDYASSATAVPIIGSQLGHFLEYLAKLTGASYSNIHLVGHSLGAHVVGTAGRFLDGKVARITGLDPAGPLWYKNPDQLNASDAVYVEAIHTNAGVLGIKKLTGDVDIFPNGGETQPGCITPICAHMRSWQLFAATLKQNHLDGYKCSSFSDMEENLCSGPTFPMGNNDLNKSGHNPDDAQYLIEGDFNSINNSDFNPDSITVVVVHGWLQSSSSLLNSNIRDPLLEESHVNVIVVDWSSVSRLDYASSATAVPIIGSQLGHFLEYLAKLTGASYSNIHLVGHSLGAHVVGTAGRFLDGKVARITGLDPAGPLWYKNPDQLNASDAVYVEAIHTNAGVLGIKKLTGDVDIFPNGGETQPGCITPICAHMRSWQLFAATLKQNHLDGYKCSSFSDMEENLCSGPTFPMGNNDLNKSGSGIYRMDTSSAYPFNEPILGF